MVERAGLENRCTLLGTEGSNPSLSAIICELSRVALLIMSRKKKAERKKTSNRRKRIAGKKIKKEAARRKTKKPIRKKAAGKKSAKTKKTATGRRTSPRKRSAKKRKTSPLGRPKVSGDEKLFMLFKEDYHARQIFEFLRVETVRELEEYSPEEIVRLLSRPIRQTVRNIRQRLADKNRHLKDDLDFASQQKDK